MGRKILIIALLIICFAGIASAPSPPPFTSGSFPSGYTIEFPNINYLQQNTTFNFYVHVYNASNGVPVSNATTNCTLHIYNSVGSHIIESKMPYNSTDMDFGLKILGGNFSENGLYSFITYCHSSTQGGYVENTIRVTSTGDYIPEGMPTFLGILVIIIFGTACFMMFLSVTMNEVGFKIFFMVTSIIFLMASLITGYMVLTDSNVTASISTTTLGLIVVIGIILFIIFAWILIRQTINALDLYNVKRGKSWNVGSGSSVGGYNTKRAY